MTTIKSSTKRTSSWAAARSPLVPHLAFLVVCLFVKLVFPATLKWLAYDSISTLLLSVWYPLCATISLIHQHQGTKRSPDDGATDSLQVDRQFWIEYWSVGFAGVQFLHNFISVVPLLQQMGRHDYPQLPVILNEVKMLFFVWIFVMETLLARYQRYLGVDERKENWKNFVPLTVLTKAIKSRLVGVQTAISEQISKNTWQRLIKRKAHRVLEVMVMLQFLEEQSMEYLLQLLEEGRPLLPLAIFMVLPSSISQVGMLYAQFIFPSARALLARGDAVEVLSLKYWVLNNVLGVFLSVGWWLWWCVPFSNQLLLGIRCFAVFPSTITHYYSIVEMELITFGILSGEPKLTVKETKTVQALRAFVKRLPRDKQAQSFQFEIDEPGNKFKHGEDDSSIGSVDTTESERERRRKRRREKRAKKKLLQQRKSSQSTCSNSVRPPPLLSESFILRYTENEEEDDDTRQKKSGLGGGEEEKYSSFINANKNWESQSEKNDYISTLQHTLPHHKNDDLVDAPKEKGQVSHFVSEKEERDARDAATMDSAFQNDEIRHSTSMSMASDDAEVISSSLSADTNAVIPHPSVNMENEKKHRDNLSMKPSNSTVNEEDGDRVIFPSMTIGSNYSSSQIQSISRSLNLNISTPTENIVGEVEVQVRAPGQSKSVNVRESLGKSIFPATHPKSFESCLMMPSGSNEDENKCSILSSSSQRQGLNDNINCDVFESDLCLSDIDTTTSSMIEGNASVGPWSPFNEESIAEEEKVLKDQKQFVDGNPFTIAGEVNFVEPTIMTTTDNVDSCEMPNPPRRSSRLIQLREWQEQQRQGRDSKIVNEGKVLAAKSLNSEKIAKKSKKSKGKNKVDGDLVKASRSEESVEKKSKRSSKASSLDKKVKKSTRLSTERETRISTEREKNPLSTFVGDEDRNLAAASPKKISKKSKAIISSERESVASKSTASSIGKRVKKKSAAASPEKSRRSSRNKDTTENEGSRTSSSSPEKTVRNKPRKVPNSRRKKKDVSTIFGGVLSRN